MSFRENSESKVSSLLKTFLIALIFEKVKHLIKFDLFCPTVKFSIKI